MLYVDLKRLIDKQQIPKTKVFSLGIPDKEIEQFIKSKTSNLIRINSSTKYVEQCASNKAKIFESHASIDAWSYDPSSLDELEQQLRTVFEDNGIYIISSSIDVDSDIDAYRLKLKLKQ